MDKISVYILDTRKVTLNELFSFANLDDEEVKSLEKYKVIEVKKEKVASLYFKNKYIGETTVNDFGKPISDKCYFNISHSKGVVVLAISQKHDIGVDVEVIREKDEDLVKYISSDVEYAFIKNELDFFSVWTNKESLVKCLGTGIRNKVKSIPSLPLDGVKEFCGETFYSKVIKNNDYLISLTIKDKNDFDFDLIMEEIRND